MYSISELLNGTLCFSCRRRYVRYVGIVICRRGREVVAHIAA